MQMGTDEVVKLRVPWGWERENVVPGDLSPCLSSGSLEKDGDVFVKCGTFRSNRPRKGESASSSMFDGNRR